MHGMSDHEGILLGEILTGTTALIGGVPADRRTAPTPCPDLDVAGLVDHLVGWLRAFEAALAQRPAGSDPGAYRTGDDPAGEFSAAARGVLTAWRSGDPDGTLQLTGPPLPRSFAYPMMLGEYLVHGWDLARATGQPVPFTDAQAAAALDGLRGMLRPEFRGPGRPFGEEVTVGPDAGPVEKVVAFAGRDPQWTSPADA